ncbi:MAG: di-heme oxidoredictase family protein [Pseudomonadota bacterium]
MKCKLFVLLILVHALSCKPLTYIPAFEETEMRPGGDMTAKRLSDRTFILAGDGISNMDELRFWTGLSLFKNPWVIGPSSTTDRDGLGPLFHTRSCISCHIGGARGHASPEGISKPSGLVLRLGPTGRNTPMSDPIYGGQIQPRGIRFAHQRLPEPVKGEAKLDLSITQITRHYADGEAYTLYKPMYQLAELAYGPIQEGIGISPRFAPAIYGLGLIDAIGDKEFLALEDPRDDNSDGISPRYNRVPNVATGDLEIGRFGFKAKHPTLVQQVAAAFRDDIGITNPMFPDESCTTHQNDCHIASALGGGSSVEIPGKLISLVNDFTYWLAVPPARNILDEEVQRGRSMFFNAECHACHTPSFTTSPDYPDPNLANQKIYPYSNFALHDMGPELADGVSEYDADGREWRTPPLWGIGLQQQFRSKTRYLHDGRAKTLEEAILWHGGEGAKSRDKFINFNKSDRESLIAFIKSI